MEEHGKGINIEHHDHDYHPHAGAYPGYAYPGYGCGYGGYGTAAGVFGIVAFIAFIVILWGVWAAHNRHSDHHVDQIDKHNDTLRCMDGIKYELGYTRKQLNDMQCLEDKIYEREERTYDRMCQYHEEELRFGTPYGEHTQHLPLAQPLFCGQPMRTQPWCEPCHRGHMGGVVNGSTVTETSNRAVDRSVLI